MSTIHIIWHVCVGKNPQCIFENKVISRQYSWLILPTDMYKCFLFFLPRLCKIYRVINGRVWMTISVVWNFVKDIYVVSWFVGKQLICNLHIKKQFKMTDNGWTLHNIYWPCLLTTEYNEINNKYKLLICLFVLFPPQLVLWIVTTKTQFFKIKYMR
jgi:hypothetical protein